MFYEEILGCLYKEKIRFAVAGGVALVLHGVVRLTIDLDLIVYLKEDNIEKFLSVLKDLGYKSKLPVAEKDFLDSKVREKWRDEKNMVVFSFYHPDKKINLIDVFIGEQIPFDEIEKELVWFNAGKFKIPVISKKHLKLLKQISGRPQDIADIEGLEALEQEKDKNV